MGFSENYFRLKQQNQKLSAQRAVEQAGQNNGLLRALDQARLNLAARQGAGQTGEQPTGNNGGNPAGNPGGQSLPDARNAAQQMRETALSEWQKQQEQRKRAQETAMRDQEAGYKRTQQLEALYNPQAAERYKADAGEKAQSAAELARSAKELRQKADTISGEREKKALALTLPTFGRDAMAGDQARALETELRGMEAQERLLRQQADELERQGKVATWSAERDTQRADYLSWVQPYLALTRNADFAEKSEYQTEQTGKDGGWLASLATKKASDLVKWKNPLYEAINGNEEAGLALYGKDQATGRTMDPESRRIAQMTAQEKQIYNYLYKTRGIIQANKYYSELAPELNARASEAEKQSYRDLVHSGAMGAIAGNLLSVGMNVVKPGAYILQLADAIGKGEVDPNAGYNRLSYIPSTIRAETGAKINKTLGDTWGKIGEFGYQTFMSIADFLTTTAVSGGFGASAGAAEEWLNLGIMGTGAAADAVIAARERGVDTAGSMVIGTVAGAAEMITEKVSLETLMDPDLLADGKLKYILKNVLAEGSEEGASDLINFTADALYETLTHSGKSELETRIRELMERGHTRPEATGIALGQKAEELGLSVLGGALSGGIMAGGNVALGEIQQAAMDREIGSAYQNHETARALVQEGLDSAPGSEARKIAERNLGRLEAGQALSARRLGQQVRANDAANQDGRLVLPSVEREQTAAVEEQGASAAKMSELTLPGTEDSVKSENAAPDGTAENTDARAVVAKLQRNIPDMQNDRSVVTLTGTEFPKSGGKLTDQVGIFFQKIGNMVQRSGLGSVLLDRRGVKSDIAHGIGRAKVVTFAAVPAVIEQGRQIDFQPNWKGREYDTYVFAAPVDIAGKRTYVAAVVRSDTENRFYLHEVVDENGNLIYKIDAPAAIQTGVTVQDGITGTAETSTTTNLAQQQQNVNRGLATFSEAVMQQLTGDSSASGKAGQQQEKNQARESFSDIVMKQLTGESGTENQTGGNEYAEAAGRVSDGDQRRDAGIRAGEPSGGLGSRAKGWKAAAGQLRAASQRRAAGRDLRQVSARSLGVNWGHETETVRVLPEDRWDPELREAAATVRRETGLEPVFILGSVPFTKTDGSTGYARGVKTAQRIIVQADHSSVTATQIAMHETWHALSERAPAMRDEAERKIRERYGSEEFDAVMDEYTKGLVGVIDVPKLDMRDQYYLRALDRIREELLADAYAGINAFQVDAGRFQEEVAAVKREFWDFPASDQTASATERTTGPPELYSLRDTPVPTYEELIRKPDVPVVDIRRTRSGSFAQEREAFLNSERARRLYAAPVVNRDTGESIFITPHTIKHTFSNLGWEQIELVERLPEIIENAVLTHAEPSRKAPTDRTTGVFTLFGAARAEEGVQPLKLTVKEYKIQNQQLPENISDYLGTGIQPETYASIYDGKVLVLEYIEKESPSSSASSWTKKNQDRHPSGLSPKISVKDLLALVKGDAARYVPQVEDWQQMYSVDDELAAEYQRRSDVQYRRELMETNREEFNANEARRREIRKQIGKETSKRLEAEAVRQELDKLRDIDYQKGLLETGGAEAIAENQKQVERLQDRLDRMEGRETGWEQRLQQRRERRQAEAQRREQLRQEAEAKEDQRRKREAEAEEENRKRALQREEQRHQEALQRTERRRQEAKERREQAKGKPKKPVAESKPIIAKKDFRQQMLGLFSIPNGMRAEMGALADEFADRVLKQGSVAQKDIDDFFDRMYRAGVMTVQADEYARAGRSAVQGGHIYVSPSVKADFGEDWNHFRIHAMAQGIYLTNDSNDRAADQWNAELAESFPGIFDPDDLDQRDILERIVQMAEDGRDEHMSLEEYAKYLSGQEYITEDEIMENLERQVEWAISTFAKTARIELNLRERTGIKMAEEREKSRQAIQAEREESWKNRQADREENRVRMLEERERSARAIQAEREKSWEQLKAERAREAQRREKERQQRREWEQKARENRELSELQQKTLKQLQWLSKNRDRAPAELRAVWDNVLGDIDIYAASAANEMRWSPKHQDTWRNLADMYKSAKENDPNFLPSKEMERIVARLDGDKLADMDLGALQDLYKAAVGLRTEFYNRRNLVQDELHRAFSDMYGDIKEELTRAAGKHDGAKDVFFNDLQLTPMNAMLRMSGWDEGSQFYSLAKMLERGERDVRRFEVDSKAQLDTFLRENRKWVKRADGQGKKAIWYEVEVPELLEFGKGNKPIFGDTVKVWMTPAQKVHLYLESKSYDNIRHMLGGRTFANKELYAQGKRTEAFAEGTTIKLAPETVKKLVSDLTPEEQALADVLERYYNETSRKEINRVSNVLYGFDKAISQNYAPIYTNANYVKSDPGVFDLTAEGVGNLKSRQYAKNPSYNIAAFDAFERSVRQSAKFVGMAIPIRNVNTMMNWMEQGNSMRDVLTHAWGKKGADFVDNLLTELQGGREIKKEKLDAFINKELGRYIKSVFGANPSIVLKQFASYPLAASYLGWSNMPKWVPGAAQVDRELIRRYTGELAVREMGYAMPETAILKDNPGKLQEKGTMNFVFGGGAIPWMDGFTVRCLWTWAENKVRKELDLQPGEQEQIDAGTDAYYKAVAAEFEEAVSRSQPMYDVMHRSEAMRVGGGLGRAFTLFKTVPQQEYNMLRETFGVAGAMMRKLESVRNRMDSLETELKSAELDAESQASKEAALERLREEEKEAEKAAKKARRKAGNAVLGILTGNLMIGAITFLSAVAKNKVKKYLGEDEELTTESVMEELGKQYLKDSLGLVLGGDVLGDILGNIFFGDKWYEIDAPGITQINDIIQTVLVAGNAVGQLVGDSIDVLQNGGDWAQYMRDHSADYISAVDKIVSAVGTYAGGLPIENVKSYLLGAVSWISPEIKTAYDDTMKKAKKAGLKGLTGGALEIRISHLMDDHGVDLSDAAAETLAGLYAAGAKGAIPSDAPKSVTVDGVERAISLADEQTWKKVWSGTVNAALDELLASDEFASADQAAQEKMLKRLYDCATEAAKMRLWYDYPMSNNMEGMEAITGTGISLAEWDIIAQKRADLETTEGIGASMRATEFAQWVDERGYTDGQAAVIKDRMGFYSAARAEAGRYEAMTEAGLSTGQAGDLARALATLEPEDGKESVSKMQQFRAIAESKLSDQDKLAAIGTIMGSEMTTEEGNPSAYAKMHTLLEAGVTLDQYLDLNEAGAVDGYLRYTSVSAGRNNGITPDAYIDFRARLPRYDADQNGSFSQKEVQAALDSMGGGGLSLPTLDGDAPKTLTNTQKAVLWQLYNKSWKPWNNPFDVTVGQWVYDALWEEPTERTEELRGLSLPSLNE